jgi:hypothetical protein
MASKWLPHCRWGGRLAPAAPRLHTAVRPRRCARAPRPSSCTAGRGAYASHTRRGSHTRPGAARLGAMVRGYLGNQARPHPSTNPPLTSLPLPSHRPRSGRTRCAAPSRRPLSPPCGVAGEPRRGRAAARRRGASSLRGLIARGGGQVRGIFWGANPKCQKFYYGRKVARRPGAPRAVALAGRAAAGGTGAWPVWPSGVAPYTVLLLRSKTVYRRLRSKTVYGQLKKVSYLFMILRRLLGCGGARGGR